MPLSTERRDAKRYPVTGELEYRLAVDQEYSRGFVRNLSNTGLLLRCDPALEPGLDIELLIPWQAGKGKTIKLYVAGQTVRAEGDDTGVRIERAAFRLEH